MAALAWWLNLDAERELEAPAHYRPDPRIEARIEALRPQLTHLLGSDGGVVGRDALAAETPTLAWCPTPTALAGIRGAGLVPPKSPGLAVLQRVNHRSFCAALGQTLPGAAQVDDLAALRDVVRGEAPTGDWVIKRPFGFAGRERRRAIGGVLDDSTEGFARASLARGEVLQVEPWVRRLADVALHGWVDPAGHVSLASPIEQQCDAQGRFQGVVGAASRCLSRPHAARLREEGMRVGEALRDAHYFGPFGVDAYVYLDPGDRTRLNPRSEINARFTMGYVWPPGIDRPPR